MLPVSSTTPLWIASRKLLWAHGDEFFLRWAKAAKGFGVDEIHDLRVASRRLREGLTLFQPCYPEKGLARVSKRVKQVTGMLGPLRNTDESLLFFSTLAPEERREADQEIRTLLAQLQEEGAAARKRLKGDLLALKPGPLESALNMTLDNPRLFGNTRVDPFQDFALFADGTVAARALPINGLLSPALDEANISAQHLLRIAVKRMRYHLEILAPLFDAGFPELHRALKGFQEVLGTLHDLDVFAGQVLSRIPGGAGQQCLLEGIAARRSRCYSSFLTMHDTLPLDAIADKARSYL